MVSGDNLSFLYPINQALKRPKGLRWSTEGLGKCGSCGQQSLVCLFNRYSLVDNDLNLKNARCGDNAKIQIASGSLRMCQRVVEWPQMHKLLMSLCLHKFQWNWSIATLAAYSQYALAGGHPILKVYCAEPYRCPSAWGLSFRKYAALSLWRIYHQFMAIWAENHAVPWHFGAPSFFGKKHIYQAENSAAVCSAIPKSQRV